MCQRFSTAALPGFRAFCSCFSGIAERRPAAGIPPNCMQFRPIAFFLGPGIHFVCNWKRRGRWPFFGLFAL